MIKDFKEITGIKIGDTVLIKGRRWFDKNFNESSQCIQNYLDGLSGRYITKAHLRLLGKTFKVDNIDILNGYVNIIETDGSTWNIPTWLIESVA